MLAQGKKDEARGCPKFAAVPLPNNLPGIFENGPISTGIDASSVPSGRRQCVPLTTAARSVLARRMDGLETLVPIPVQRGRSAARPEGEQCP